VIVQWYFLYFNRKYLSQTNWILAPLHLLFKPLVLHNIPDVDIRVQLEYIFLGDLVSVLAVDCFIKQLQKWKLLTGKYFIVIGHVYDLEKLNLEDFHV
jgi:hypothetical protein